ncbi:MAG: GGDEF domain-containing protein [Oscillibacter sp.]|nr:GGDEF domain-containing protein [Oscillibacter sp.]
MSYKKPIQRSLLIGCLVFIVCLCASISVLSWSIFSKTLYQDCEVRLRHIITYVEHNLDHEDLAACINSGVPSYKYQRLQQLLNVLVDDYELYYLYIVIPLDTETGTMMNVVSATSAAERAAGETDMPLLLTSDAYPKEEIDRYLEVWKAGGIVYFEENSGFGHCYTACKPLHTQDGRTFALLCADLSVEGLRRTVRNYVVAHLALTITVGALFGLMMMVWLRQNVTGPVLALERSTLSFAEKSHRTRDPSELSYDAPEIHTLNEVESLADAIARMSEDIKSYIEDVLYAEGRVRSAEKEVEGMTRMAYSDALTHVKNKAACDEKMSALTCAVNTSPPEYAILMVDLNCLKRINDTYGHEKGDEYIIGASQIVSGVFKHSPVYRVGGDEFVVVLQGEDYLNRETLFQSMRERFREAEEDETRAPWRRYSAAAGMAVSAPGEDASLVLKRADQNMYRDKKESKERLGLSSTR